MTTLAKKTPYLTRKGNRYYFRIRIPDDLRKVIGKNEHTEALGDVNQAQAEVLTAQLGAKWQERLLRERYALGLASAPPLQAPPPPAPVERVASIEQAQAVAAIAGRELLAIDEDSRADGSLWELPAISEEFGPGPDLRSALPLAVSGRDPAGISSQAEDWLGSYGLRLPTDSAERRRVLYAFAQGLGKAAAAQSRRNAGEVVETPPKSPLPAALANPDVAAEVGAEQILTLRDVFDLWKRKPSKTGKALALKTVQRGLEVVEAFEEACGNTPVTQLTRAHAQQLRDFYLAKGLEPGTAKDRVDWVRSMLNYEVEEGHRLKVNPWPRIKVEGATESGTDRKATRAAELSALFSLPLFQAYILPTAANAGRDAAYWVPLLGSYTGARMGIPDQRDRSFWPNVTDGSGRS